MRRWIAPGLCVLAVGCVSLGCGSRSYYSQERRDPWTWSRARHASQPRHDVRPSLRLTDEEVAAAMVKPAASTGIAPVADVARTEAVEVVAADVADAYGEGDRARARALIAAHPGVVDWSDRSVVVTCRFVGGWEGAVELTCIRTDTSLGADRGALAVCFEPGTYGAPVVQDPDDVRVLADRRPHRGEARPDGWNPPDSERRYRHWPAPQDLAFLRAPVVVIPAGQDMATVRVPVACASFHRGAPGVGQPYALARFPEGSLVDQLMVVLCQGVQVAGDAEAQLAVWMARDDITWAQFVAEGGDRGRLVTFGQSRSVRSHHADGAARLLLRAGSDPRTRQFFDDGVAAPRSEPEVTPDVAPAVEPPPTAPEPTPQAGESARHLS